MTLIEKLPALKWKYPNAQIVTYGELIVGWNSASPPPNDAEIEAIYQEYVKYKASVLYQEKRAPEYPPVQEGLDALVHKELGDPGPWNEYVAKCVAVKDKYPQPEAKS